MRSNKAEEEVAELMKKSTQLEVELDKTKEQLVMMRILIMLLLLMIIMMMMRDILKVKGGENKAQEGLTMCRIHN